MSYKLTIDRELSHFFPFLLKNHTDNFQKDQNRQVWRSAGDVPRADVDPDRTNHTPVVGEVRLICHHRATNVVLESNLKPTAAN